MSTAQGIVTYQKLTPVHLDVWTVRDLKPLLQLPTTNSKTIAKVFSSAQMKPISLQLSRFRSLIYGTGGKCHEVGTLKEVHLSPCRGRMHGPSARDPAGVSLIIKDMKCLKDEKYRQKIKMSD